MEFVGHFLRADVAASIIEFSEELQCVQIQFATIKIERRATANWPDGGGCCIFVEGVDARCNGQRCKPVAGGAKPNLPCARRLHAHDVSNDALNGGYNLVEHHYVQDPSPLISRLMLRIVLAGEARQ